MSLGRARIIKASVPASTSAAWRGHAPAEPAKLARRIPRAVLDGRDEAARIVAEARTQAEAILAEARASVASIVENAARDARERELARVAAEVLVDRHALVTKAEQEIDQTIALASLLAERIVGESLAVDPSRIAVIASHALEEARGARRVRIEASREDAAALAALVASLGEGVATVETNDELARGSLLVHTELGRIDARLDVQLDRLAHALREAMLEEKRGARGST